MKKGNLKFLLVFCLLFSLITNIFIFPSVSNAGAPDGVSLKLYTWDEAQNENNILKARIYLQNTGTVTLHNFDVYYYFTSENGKIPIAEGYYMPGPQPAISVQSMGGSQYALKLHFANVNFAPESVIPNTAGYTIGIHYMDWSVMDKANDYSYTGGAEYNLNDKVTVYGLVPDVPMTALYYGIKPTSGIQDYVINYAIRTDWGNAATVDVTITNNTDSDINGWTLGWTFPGNQSIYELWRGTYTQTGNKIAVTNLDYDKTIPANGGKETFGFNLKYSGQNLKPTDFVLNGPFETDLDKPEPSSTLNIRKFIVSDIGETVKYNSYIGEPVIQRLYYKNPTDKTQNILITDNIKNYTKVLEILNQGIVNGNNIQWSINNVAPGGAGYVEVKVTSDSLAVVKNKAILTVQGTSYDSNETSVRFIKKPAKGWMALDPNSKPGDRPTANMKEDTTSGFMCNFNIPGISVSEVKNGDTSYQSLDIPGYLGSMDSGKPQLPIMGNVFEVPEGVDFSVEIYKSKCITVKDFRIIPSQIEWDGPSASFEMDKVTYVKNDVTPQVIANANKDNSAVVRGRRLLYANINPVQYNPATGEMKVYSNIEFRVKYNSPAQIEEVPERLESEAYEEMFKNVVVNYKPAKVTNGTTVARTRGAPETGCDYLILTHNDFYNGNDLTDKNNPLNMLAAWKEQKGLKTSIVEISTINANPTAEDIAKYISDGYKNWTRVPSYILLVGDSDFIPTHYKTPHSAHKNTLIGTDLYYATVDGSDIFPDIYMGRLSVDTRNECSDVIAKILDYEKNPPANNNYYTDCSFVGAMEDTNNDGTEDDRKRIQIMEDMRDHAVNNGYNVERIYNVNYDKALPTPATGPQKYNNGTVLPNDLTNAGGFMWDGGAADISNQINNGNWLVMYAGHGGRDGWGNPDFHNNDVTALTNTEYPVVLSYTCQTGWFDNETDDAVLNTKQDDESFCETFLRAANYGCSGIIGSTRNAPASECNYSRVGIYKALNPSYNPNPPIKANQITKANIAPLNELGQLKDFASVFSAACKGKTPSTVYMEEFTTFGDPNMTVWNHSPNSFVVDYPGRIGETGEQDFVVNVKDNTSSKNVSSATVTLVRNGEILDVCQTDPAGNARFKLSPGTGDIKLTVTKAGYRPSENYIKVSANGADVSGLSPEDGTTGQSVTIEFEKFGYRYEGEFSFPEYVDIYFGGKKVGTTDSGVYTFTVPAGTPKGPVNIDLVGQTTGRHALEVFTVRGANPIDLYSYSQWDSSTYDMTDGGDPTWNSPDIQLYDSSGNPVNSGDLEITKKYKIRSVVHNDTKFKATNAKVTFKWAKFGVAQPNREWNLIGEATININAKSTANAEIAEWTPPSTGHICIMAEIYHIEDINTDNNKGQENCSVGISHSPAEVKFDVWNPTTENQQVYFVLRQVSNNGGVIWPSTVKHPDPQTIAPGQSKEASIIVDPTLIGVKSGQEEFSLTGYINGEIMGGVNFIVKKEP